MILAATADRRLIPDPKGADPRPRRIAYIMSRFPKISETFVLFEMKALEALGSHVEVFPLRREPPGPRHAEAMEYEERAHLPSLLSWSLVRANVRLLWRDPRRYVLSWWDALEATGGSLPFVLGALVHHPKCILFAERMLRLRIDHIHAHFATHAALAALVIHRLTGIPFSFTAHGSDLHVERRGLSRKVSEASFVVTISRYNRDLIIGDCGEAVRDKVVVVHCGADPTVFSDTPVARQKGPSGRNNRAMRIVCVARFAEVKGHRFLVEACRLLADAGVEVHCDLIGDGPLLGEVKRFAETAGIAERIRFHGALPRSDVSRMLARSDVAVLASYPTKNGQREGIPVALMEAMMAGLPVVASGLSGIPELVEDERTGYLVPPGDPWTLADRLGRLADSPPLREAMGAEGRRRACARFDLRKGAALLLRQIECRASASRVRDT